MNTQQQLKKKHSKKKEKPKLSPEQYKKYLKQTELESIILNTCSAKVRREHFRDSMKSIVSDKVKYKVPETNVQKAILWQEYQLVITSSTKRGYAVRIVCEFEVELTSEAEISEDFLEIFSKVNLHVNTWPYFREFVQNMLQRMGLPPLTLPFLKS